jgi:hypothetical protein
MLFSLSGVKLPHRKNTQDMKPVRIESVSSVEIPMSMHIGKPATPTVASGDKVYVGTLIGKQEGFVSSNVYSLRKITLDFSGVIFRRFACAISPHPSPFSPKGRRGIFLLAIQCLLVIKFSQVKSPKASEKGFRADKPFN